MGFFQDVGGIVKSGAESLTGKTNADLYKQSLANQQAMNQQVFDLERERQARLNSPEYRKQQTIKIIVVGVIFVIMLFVSYKILAK